MPESLPIETAKLDAFAKEIAKIHQRIIAKAYREIEAIERPISAHDHAVSDYFKSIPPDEFLARLIQYFVEGAFHDLFFLFEDHPEFKISVAISEEKDINLAYIFDELRVKPSDWIEKWSKYGLESDRRIKFISKELGLGL